MSASACTEPEGVMQVSGDSCVRRMASSIERAEVVPTAMRAPASGFFSSANVLAGISYHSRGKLSSSIFSNWMGCTVPTPTCKAKAWKWPPPFRFAPRAATALIRVIPSPSPSPCPCPVLPFRYLRKLANFLRVFANYLKMPSRKLC